MEIKTIRISFDLLGNIVDSYENFIENGSYVYQLELALNLGTNEEIYYNVRRADSSVNTNPIKVTNNIIELNAWHTEVPGVLEITPFIYNSETAQRKFYQTVILNVENYLYSGVSSETYETPSVSFAAFNLESNPFSNILKVKYDLKGIPNGWENSYIGSIYRGSNASDKIQVEFEESIPNSNTVVFMAKRPDGTTTSEYLTMTRVDSHTFEFYLVDWFTIDSGNMECNVQVIGNVENNIQQKRTYGIFNIQIKDTVKSSNEEISTNLDIVTQILNRLSTVENNIMHVRTLTDVDSKNIESDANLNTVDYLYVGTYAGDNRNATMENCPSETEFKMEVFSIYLNEVRDPEKQNWVYRLRIITDLLGNQFIQKVNSGHTAGIFSFSSWIRIATSNDLAIIEDDLKNYVPNTGDKNIYGYTQFFGGVGIVDNLGVDSINISDGVIYNEGIYELMLPSKSGNIALLDDVDEKIADLVGTAPETLDTLSELATAFKTNEDMIKVLEDAIVLKADDDKVIHNTGNQVISNGGLAVQSYVKVGSADEIEIMGGQDAYITIDGTKVALISDLENIDVSNKFDKSGGHISGNVSLGGYFEIDTNPIIGTDNHTIIKDNSYSEAFGASPLQIGDIESSVVMLRGPNQPNWQTQSLDGSQVLTKKIIVEDDLEDYVPNFGDKVIRGDTSFKDDVYVEGRLTANSINLVDGEIYAEGIYNLTLPSKSGTIAIDEDVQSLKNKILDKQSISIECPHQLEYTGYGQNDCNFAVDDQQMLITKIEGRTTRVSPNLFDQHTILIQTVGMTYQADGSYYGYSSSITRGIIWKNVTPNDQFIFSVNIKESLQGIGFNFAYSDGTSETKWASQVGDSYHRFTYISSSNKRLTSISTVFINGGVNYYWKDIYLYSDINLKEYIKFDDNLTGVQNSLLSTGKNLWDEQWETGSFDSSTGEPITYPCIRNKNIIPVLPNTTYYIGDGINGGQVFFYDKAKKYLSYGELSVFTTPSNCYFIKFRMSTDYGENYKQNIIVAYGNTAVNYEQYKEDRLVVEPLLNEFDYIDNVSGRIIKQTSDVVTLYGSMNWSKASTNYNYVTRFDVEYDISDYDATSYRGIGVCNVCEWTQVSLFADVQNMSICSTTNGAKIYVLMPKSTGITTLEDFKTWVSQNNIKFVYKLANPSADEETNVTSAGVAVYKGGMQYQEKSLTYKLTKQYTVSTFGQIMSNIEVDRKQQLTLNQTQNEIDKNYELLIDKTTKLKNGIVGLRDALSMTIEGTYLVLKCDGVVLSKVNIRDATTDPTNVVITASLTGTQYIDKRLGIVTDYEEKVYIKNNTGFAINITSITGLKFLTTNNLVGTIQNSGQKNSSANEYASTNTYNSNYTVTVNYTCDGTAYSKDVVVTPEITGGDNLM